MSDATTRATAVVRRAITDELQVHDRLQDQGLAPSAALRAEIAAAVPPLTPFRDHEFTTVRAVLDWDHRIPSQATILRIFASYDDRDATHVERQLRERKQAIDRDNLYPEFDVPDFGDIEASETYAGLVSPGASKFEDFRLLSEWRRNVDPSLTEQVLDRISQRHRLARSSIRTGPPIPGTPVVIGWTPPSLADATHWAIEVWVVVEFAGASGRVRVFMVDSVTLDITREFETPISLA